MASKGYEASATAGGRGQFDVVADGVVVFSKHEHGRFPDEDEVPPLLGSGF